MDHLKQVQLVVRAGLELEMWIEFVGSLLRYERFSHGYSGFPLSPKTNI